MRDLFLIVSFLLILNGCTNDIDVIDTPSKNNGTVTLKAVISGADTRVAMAQDELDVPPVGMYTEIEIEASEQSFRFIYYTNPESTLSSGI